MSDAIDWEFIEAERAELRAQINHHKRTEDSARKLVWGMKESHRSHVKALELKIRELGEKLAYQTRRADANWKALCECRNEDV